MKNENETTTMSEVAELRRVVEDAIDEANLVAEERFFAAGDELSSWAERQIAARLEALPNWLN